MVEHTNRRTFLKATGAAGVTGSLGLAGCVGGGGGEFPSREITIMEPYGAGSGFDAYARAVADAMQEFVDVEVIVENVTGAGGRTMVEQLYSSDPDGYTIGILNIPGFAVAQTVLDVNYDLSEMSHLGRVTRGTYTMYTASDRDDISTWEALTEMDEVNWAIEGMGTSNSFVSIVFNETAGINVNFVGGYEGSPDVRRSVIQHENDVSQHTVSSAGPLIREGDLKPLIAYADREDLPDWFPEVPHTTEEVDQFEGFADSMNISRIFSAPPDVEDDRIQTLEDTLWETFKSDALQEWAEEAERALASQLRGEESAQVIQSSIETFEPHQDIIQQYV
jgi:tripartite-type tricarboxylate transporter receptor subunit TctC